CNLKNQEELSWDGRPHPSLLRTGKRGQGEAFSERRSSAALPISSRKKVNRHCGSHHDHKRPHDPLWQLLRVVCAKISAEQRTSDHHPTLFPIDGFIEC